MHGTTALTPSDIQSDDASGRPASPRIGDSITWTSESDEIHTVTFLTAKQIFPAFQVGCPGFILSVAAFDGSTCVTTPPLNKGQSLTVLFPKAGNYKLVCLVHNTMNGTIHVLHPSEVLPHDQDY